MSSARGGIYLSDKLPPGAKHTMDRMCAEWCVDEDQGFNAASTPGFRAMMAAATNDKYDGCCDKSVKTHAAAMALEGQQECKAFHVGLLADGVKPAASGDLWSKNGTALFGLVSHGIRRSMAKQHDGTVKRKWEMVEKLSGAVPCSDHRHTAAHISELSLKAWAATGISDPIDQIFVRVSDNGANMIKGWESGFQAPCVDHTLELSANLYTHHPRIAPTLDKGRGQVGYFNSSVIGYNETTVGLHACQKAVSVPENALTQDVKTRWRSTHAMTNSLRISSEALLLYDVRNPGAAKGFVDNRFSMEDWAINNQTAAVLAPLAGASQYLEGKSYPTANLVLPSMYGCIEHMEPSSAVRQPWDGKVIRSSSLRPECQEAREEVHADLVRRWKTDIPE